MSATVPRGPESQESAAYSELPAPRRRSTHALAPVVLAALVSVLAALAVFGSPESTEAAARPTLTAHRSVYGRVLFDGRGFALYGFTADPKGHSVCTGACATAWPPYLVSGNLRPGRGVSKALFGTIRRPDGKRQLTYAGRPLYFYVGDRKPGQILCQGVTEFGGDWLVVRPNGALVR